MVYIVGDGVKTVVQSSAVLAEHDHIMHYGTICSCQSTLASEAVTDCLT